MSQREIFVRRAVRPHACHAEGCRAVVAPERLMCFRHWRRVPRAMQRAVWDAYRKECAHPVVPGVVPLTPWVTCREALMHLSPKEMGTPVRLRWKTNSHPPSRLDEPAHGVPASQPGNGGATLATGPNHRPSTLDAAARTLTRNTHSDGALLEWPWGRPGTTVDSNPNAIKLSERAAAILQGFPDGWKFCGATKRARWSQIGQAMPPALAEKVALAIAEWFIRNGTMVA